MLARQSHAHFFPDVFRQFGLEGSLASLDGLSKLLNYFDPKFDEPIGGQFRDTALKKCVDSGSEPPASGCGSAEVVPEECSDYCDIVRIGRKAEDLMEEVFWMSSDVAGNGSGGGGPLFDCDWNDGGSGECWSTIINEFGVCATSNRKG